MLLSQFHFSFSFFLNSVFNSGTLTSWKFKIVVELYQNRAKMNLNLLVYLCVSRSREYDLSYSLVFVKSISLTSEAHKMKN